ncbi:FMN-dependent NADH-azoreductase [Streptomyces sp. MBT62]|uniref:FMN-dependent NADH-azoreductase n=1 Tax=Streptomyces sp. MBT62 TaxID=2800410 RepID=UPI00190BB96E|nr:NAD(P)H-dependent oxidoreductase [Streptomyces sp. MBT62]MBK3567990.1 NAD(P)H-dependent oxidoreductase [Streptomyces sp. MBT62]
MSYLLHIDATSFDAESISRRVARSFLDAWPGKVVHRDLAAVPVPHLTAAGISARLTEPAKYTPEEAAAAAVQDELVEEFLGAAGYLFTVPLYNYGMPSSFKAWLDQIVIFGRTYSLPDGPPPTTGRIAVVVSSRGGSYGPGAPHEGRDHLLPNIQESMGRELGLELEFITIEFGLAPTVPVLSQFLPMHEESLTNAHKQARQHAEEFARQQKATTA